MAYIKLMRMFILNMQYVFFGKEEELSSKYLEVYSPIILKNNGMIYNTNNLEILGKIGYLVKHMDGDKSSGDNLILDISYKDKIKTQISFSSELNVEYILGDLLKQFFSIIYQYKDKNYLGNLFSANNDVLQITIHKGNIILLDKRYIILPIKVVGDNGIMQTKEILYEPNGYIAYQVSLDSMPILYNNMAKQILEEFKKNIKNVKE